MHDGPETELAASVHNGPETGSLWVLQGLSRSAKRITSMDLRDFGRKRVGAQITPGQDNPSQFYIISDK